MAKTAKPIQQHYVPRYYLRSFIDKKKQLYVVDRPEGKFFRVPVEGVGGTRYFNLVNVKGIDPFGVETALGELETIAAPALERVKAARSLADEKDRSAVLNLIAAVTLRNPKQRAAVNEINRQVGQQAAAAGLATKERYAKYVAAMEAQGKKVPPYEQMKEWFEKEPESFTPPPPPQEFNILMELLSHDPLVRLYEERKWQILIASEDSGGFVTCDHPVCLRWADGKDHGETSPGFAVRGTELIFPLSPTMVLRGRLDGEENVIEADAATVAGINSLLISNAHNQVYAQDALFSYKRGPKDEIGSGATLDQDRVFLAGGRRARG